MGVNQLAQRDQLVAIDLAAERRVVLAEVVRGDPVEHRRSNHRPDRGVHPAGVSAAGEHRDAGGCARRIGHATSKASAGRQPQDAPLWPPFAGEVA